jgi:hypothetical protein
MDVHPDADGVERGEQLAVEVGAGRALGEIDLAFWPSLVCTRRRCSSRSSAISTSRSPHGIGPVLRPRAVTYSVTCHQWLRNGTSAIRTLPTICA